MERGPEADARRARALPLDDATGEQQLFNIPVAETEPVIQPHAVADDLGREAVVRVAVG
jgi:hypothetical protein